MDEIDCTLSVYAAQPHFHFIFPKIALTCHALFRVIPGIESIWIPRWIILAADSDGFPPSKFLYQARYHCETRDLRVIAHPPRFPSSLSPMIRSSRLVSYLFFAYSPSLPTLPFSFSYSHFVVPPPSSSLSIVSRGCIALHSKKGQWRNAIVFRLVRVCRKEKRHVGSW